MALSVAVLDRIARTVAAQAVPIMKGTSLFNDIVNEAWLRFLRYPPRHRAGAWVMARSARGEVLRAERRQEHLRARAAQFHAGSLEPPSLDVYEELWDMQGFEGFRFLAAYAQRDLTAVAPGRVRVAAHRRRAKLKCFIDPSFCDP